MNGLCIGDLDDRRVGRIVAVSASRATVMLEEQDLHPVEIGNLVKIQTKFGAVYGMVSRLEVSEPWLTPSGQDLKTAEIEFAGEIGRVHTARFMRGLLAYPALDASVSLANAMDLRQVYARPEAATALIGSIGQDARVPAYILADELFGKHLSIVGTTGSGKSCLSFTEAWVAEPDGRQVEKIVERWRRGVRADRV